jgi:cAMP-dependent protein kinase regulator
MNLADALVPKTFSHGSVIVKQGDPADGMYFIESGKAVVSMIGSDGTERTVSLQLTLCHEGPQHRYKTRL